MTILVAPSIDGVAQSQPWLMKKYLEFEINYFQDEDGVFTAQVPAIPGCVAWGQTLEEAYQAAVEAIESCLEAWRTVAANLFTRDHSCRGQSN